MNVTRDTAEFLTQQADALNKQILDLEDQLSKFKQQNDGALPYEYASTLQLMQRTQADLAETDRTMASLQDRRVELESELAQASRDSPIKVDGSTVLFRRISSAACVSRYSVCSRLRTNHDVVRTKRQIDGLEQSTGNTTSTAADLAPQLEAAKSELAAAQQQYTPDHPEVQRLQHVVDGLEAQIASAGTGTSASGNAATTSRPTNPTYIQVQLRLQATVSDMQALQAKQESLKKTLTTYQTAIAKAPEAERLYTALSRQLDDARAQHKDITAKEMEAELSRQVEQNRKGERFELVEPPIGRPSPTRPTARVAVPGPF
jgi:chromosome segregation ATPase